MNRNLPKPIKTVHPKWVFKPGGPPGPRKAQTEMHPDYWLLEDLWQDLAGRARRAMSSGRVPEAVTLAAWMEVIDRCMHCRLKSRCGF